MTDARFCLRCGGPLTPRLEGHRTRLGCDRCGFIHYVNPVVAAGTVVERDGQVLLVQRGVEPALGQWGLPAGHAEADEMPEQAAARETYEETGLRVQVGELLGAYGYRGQSLSDGSTTPSGVVLLYAAQPVGGDLRPGDDAMAVRFFSAEALPPEIAFATHRRVLDAWAASRAIGIRPASAGDLPVIGGLVAAADEPLGIAVAEYVGVPSAAALIAWDPQGRAVGLAALRWASPEAAHLDALWVLPSHRRWGIGTKLLRAAGGQAAAWGTRELRVEVPLNAPGLRLFTGAGFDLAGYRRLDGRTLLQLGRDVASWLPYSEDR